MRYIEEESKEALTFPVTINAIEHDLRKSGKARFLPLWPMGRKPLISFEGL